ncbi:GPRNNA1 [Bugula neritina]|uniref:GPRNNA1 n=1 Tax=Bugula neritina TaxID=10212 RepID=A0A7J7KBI5_BUGNE|nr:GPRNNA1 [Bugula neritina]
MEHIIYEMCLNWRQETALGGEGVITPTNSSYFSFNESVSVNDSFSNLTEYDFREELCSENFAGITELLNEDSPITKLKYQLNGIFGLNICIFGLIGNLLSISVLKEKSFSSSSSKGISSSTVLYLIALAVADSCLLSFASFICLNIILKEALPSSTEVHNYINYTSTFVTYMLDMFQTCSTWLTVAFTVDRYIMICFPFGGGKYCTRHKALVVITCLYIASAIYNTPSLFEFKCVPQQRVRENGEKYLFVKRTLTDFGKSREYLEVYHFGMYLVFIVGLPCCTLAVLNLRLIVTVKQSKSTERRLSLGTSTARQRNDTTIMLVAVVVAFFLLQVPAMVSHLIWSQIPSKVVDIDPQYDVLRVLYHVTDLLVILNSAVNVLLYYGFSRNFRRKFIAKFCHQPNKFLSQGFRRKLSCRSGSGDGTVASWYVPKQETARKQSRSGSFLESSNTSSSLKFEQLMAGQLKDQKHKS